MPQVPPDVEQLVVSEEVHHGSALQRRLLREPEEELVDALAYYHYCYYYCYYYYYYYYYFYYYYYYFYYCY